MTTNTDVILPVFDDEGNPLSGLTPTWPQGCVNLDTGLPVAPPTITPSPTFPGVYQAPRLTGGHIVGWIDFGATAYPRFFFYNVGGSVAQVSFIAAGATANPMIVTIVAVRPTQVQITFSKPVVMTAASNGALNLANYVIAGLPITAIISLNSTQVQLTTTPQTPGLTYNLTVSNIEDLDGNVIAPG